jgi:hypothetical protein
MKIINSDFDHAAAHFTFIPKKIINAYKNLTRVKIVMLIKNNCTNM